jgi:hypothetical protein
MNNSHEQSFPDSSLPSQLAFNQNYIYMLLWLVITTVSMLKICVVLLMLCQGDELMLAQ